MKKEIQIFYGGFKFVKGGVNSHSKLLKESLSKKYDVSLITLDDLSLLVRFLPHLIEKIINFFYLPMGFYYKGKLTQILFKFFFNKKCDYRIFEDIYISWNSNIPSVTIMHAVWSDNLQRYKIKKNSFIKLKNKEVDSINSIKHSICTVSEPYRKYLINKHFGHKIKKNISIVELGIKKINNIHKKKLNLKSLIYVGSLEARKNITFLFKVFKKIYEYDKSYKLTIIGDGPDKIDLQKFKKKYNLPIKFLGNKNQNEIFRELKKHGIYIHTSVKESFSLSLLEAKISGLVTIAYNKLEVPKEFIDIGVNNFNLNKWFNKIIFFKNKNKKKFNSNKFLINNSSKKLIERINNYGFEKSDFFNKLTNKELEIFKNRYNIKEKFIFTYCPINKVDEYLLILKSLEILKSQKKNIKLFIITEQFYNFNKNYRIKKLINKLNLEKNIKVININSQFDLICFCKLSKLFIFPISFKKLNTKYLEFIVSKVPTLFPDKKELRKFTKKQYICYSILDPLSLADKITYILSDKFLQKKIYDFNQKLN